MTPYNWLSLAGIPSIITAILLYFIRSTHKQFKAQKLETARQTNALKLASQAMLRDRLYMSYQYCTRRGYTELWERDNFLNLYTQYHALGANGVMDDIKERFFELPDKTEYEMRRE